MSTRKIFIYLLIICLFVIFIDTSVAQMKSLHKFKGVKIPFKLVCKDSALKAGTYGLEFFKHETQPTFFLRILKGRKKLCLIQGEKLTYKTRGTKQLSDPDIPEKPKLRMRKNPTKKIITVIFETGKKSRVYPFTKVKFEIEYEE